MTLENIYIKPFTLHIVNKKTSGSAKKSYLDRCTFKHHLTANFYLVGVFCNYCKREDWTQVGGNMELGGVGVVHLNIYNGPINN